jgi:hypothetical protein
MDEKELCLNLIKCDNEEEVINQLKKAGYWDDSSVWCNYGQNENNYSTVGNQQSSPENALVEKITNSIDAVLIRECLVKGIDPEGPEAPKDINNALWEFFKIPDGKLYNITSEERVELAEGNIFLIASGLKELPSYSIIDLGEGQTPNKMPDTFLSISKSNKFRIQFVQGKYNMGGTGALRFCGKNNLQLIVSKRHPKIVKIEKSKKLKDDSLDLWGFTVVRRDAPKCGERSSVYRYLAPGEKIMRFFSQHLPLLPGKHDGVYCENATHGSLVKLYEYQLSKSLRTTICFDLYNRLSLLIPSIALPVRLYERRGYKGHSLETTLSGLSVRLEEDKRENLEESFPSSSTMTIQNYKVPISIYVFKEGQSDKYVKDEGIIFTVNGQFHGDISRHFFRRTSIDMDYLLESILIIVDCSGLARNIQEDLFAGSRDRLINTSLKKEIENELEDIIRNHAGLKELKEKRRRQKISEIKDNKYLNDIISSLIQKSSVLSKLLIDGERISNPIKSSKAIEANKFNGKKFPTFFKLKEAYTNANPKICNISHRFRIAYTTDAFNDYFSRDSEPGNFYLEMNGKSIERSSISLWNGTAILNVYLPAEARVNDICHFISSVDDNNRPEPIVEEFWTYIKAESPYHGPGPSGNRLLPPGNLGNGSANNIAKADLPPITEVRESEWDKYKFTKETALTVIRSGASYDFFLNMDNLYLRTEKKNRKKLDEKVLDAIYRNSLVLIGMLYLSHCLKKNEKDDKEDSDLQGQIKTITEALSPMIIPMVLQLGELSTNDLN